MDRNYTVVETSKLAAVRGDGHIYSLVSEDDIMNGSLGYVGKLSDNISGQETYDFETFDSSTINKKRAILVAHPEWDYDETRRENQALYNFINPDGIPFRGYSLIEGDVFAISATGFDASGVESITKDQYVILDADKTTLKIVEDETATAGKGFVGVIEGEVKRGFSMTSKGGVTYGRPTTLYWVHVLRNDIID